MVFLAAMAVIAVSVTLLILRPQGNSKNDPRFDTCAEANSHSYGPYRRGADPEYVWYEDRNRDGVVCN